MQLYIFDHVIAGLLIIAMPYYATWQYRRMTARLEAGEEGARLSAYRSTMAVEWALSAVVVGLWILPGRAPGSLGLGVGRGAGWWIGVALGLAACIFVYAQAASVLKDPEGLPAIRKQFGSLENMLPRSTAETRAFNALSVTAGVCEEVLYRGFLIAYLKAITGAWPSALLSSAVFGLGHSYQGTKGVIKTGILGLVMAGLYVISGSLIVPIVVHAVIDIVSGHVGRKAIASRGL